MDEQALKQLLTEIAEDEVSNDMNLMPEIRAALDRATSPKPKRVLRMAHAIAAIAIFALSAVAVYAVYQELRGGDPGLNAVNADNQIVFFEQTQPIVGGEDYDLAVTLNFAYADANRISTNFTVTGQATSSEMITPYANPTLTDDNGNQYIWLPVGGGGGGGGGSSDPDELIPFSISSTANFDASLLTEAPEELNLQLKVEVAYSRLDDPQIPQGMIFAGDTIFEFTLPFNPGRVMDTPQTVESDTLDMTLQKVVVAPSLTRIELCYETRQQDAYWTPFGRLEVGGEVVAEGQFILAGIGGQPLMDGYPCRALIIPDALQDAQGEWQLSIESLTQPGSANPDEVVRLMRERYGVQVIAHPDGGFEYQTDTPVPEGVDLNAAFDEIAAELQRSIPGPWVFTFTVPE